MTRVGLSFHPALAPWLAQTPRDVECVEIFADRFVGDARGLADALRARHPLVVRTGFLSLASPAWDSSMLPSLASFAAEVGTPWVADHLGFRYAEGIDFGVSCPMLLDRRALDMVAARAVNAMSACGTRLLIRNVASPLAIENPIPEPEFLCRLCELAGCELSLDVCALMVNARNHHFDPRAWLAGIDHARIAQVHVGGCRDVNGRFDDTHDAPIDDETWTLIADALRVSTPDVVTLQWEARFPPTPVIESELRNLKALIAP